MCRILLWSLGFSVLRPLAFSVGPYLLDEKDIVGSLLLETLEIQLFDVLRQWDLPRLLPVVGHASQFLGVHPEFSCHLNMNMGKVEPPSGIDPCLEFGSQLLLLGHIVTP